MVNRFMTSGGPAPRGDARSEMRLLGATPSFRDAPAKLLAAMVEAGHVVRIRPDWALLTEQTPADKAYVLLDGRVQVRRRGEDLGDCRAGEILGELGIVQRRLRSATVVSDGPVTLLHLTRPEFERLYDEERYFRDLVGEAVTRKSA